MSVFLQPIYTQTVGSGGAASITFNSIPQTFTDLKLVISARLDGTSGDFGIRFNADSTNSYSWTYLTGNGSSAYSGRLGSGSLTEYPAGTLNGTDTTSLTFSPNDIYIANYAGSNYKSIICDAVRENNGTTGITWMDAGLWSKTNAITSMTIRAYAGNGNFVQYSTFSLYGVLRAGI